MPPRRRSANTGSLTTEDLAVLAAAVAEGRRATVYLVEGTPSLGLEPGSSARVISVDGQTVVVRPRGVDDELPFEADELRRSKNPPPGPAPKKTAPAKKAPAKKALQQTATTTTAPPPSPASPSAAPTPAPAPVRPAPTQSAPAKRASATSGAPTSVTVTLHGAPDNTWSVAVARGARKPQRARPVSPDAVEAAVAGLGDPSSLEAVTTLLHAAREEARQRVDALSRELEEARQALAALTESGPRRTPLT